MWIDTKSLELRLPFGSCLLGTQISGGLSVKVREYFYQNEKYKEDEDE